MKSEITHSIIALAMLLLLPAVASSQDQLVTHGDVLPGTAPLVMEEPLDVVMLKGLNQFAEAELVKARRARNAPWLIHPVDSEQGKQDRTRARASLREIIGMPTSLNEQPILITSEASVGSELPWGETDSFTVRACQWTAFDNVTANGLIAMPSARLLTEQTPIVVVIPDASQTPEQMFGLVTQASDVEPLAKQLASSGCIVLCPLMIDRDHTWSTHPNVRPTNLPHREYLYRLSFPVGRHPVGYEVAKTLTGIQAIQRFAGNLGRQTAVLGIGEGGMIAMMAAAIDDQAITAVTVRGYFDQRENVWNEPAYRNLFGQLKQFGDAEIASLIAPRPLTIDLRNAPEVSGPPVVENLRDICAPGRITTPKPEHVRSEYERALAYYQRAQAADAINLLEDDSSLLAKFLSSLKMEGAQDGPYLQQSSGSDEYRRQRMKSQVKELVDYSQEVQRLSEFVRREKWSPFYKSKLDSTEATVDTFRNLVHETFIGKLDPMTCSPNPRSRKLIDEPTHAAYEIALDCYPSPDSQSDNNDLGVIAGGILLLPKDLMPGERRPVVVFQHGLESRAIWTVEDDPSQVHTKFYHGVCTQLVKQGYIVYAPQNPYIGGQAFRVLQRKSNPLGRSLFSYIVEQHRQTLKWLGSLDHVDVDRIAFYGLSYGGKTALRIPTLLPSRKDEPGYCLSICSADYNDWIRKTSSSQDRYSYVYSNEYEIYEWNIAHIANYAELTWLVYPRPFMVERGTFDPVAPDDWVAAEFFKAKRLYLVQDQGDDCELELFKGPHTINGQGTFEFLRRHLNWPETRADLEPVFDHYKDAVLVSGSPPEITPGSFTIAILPDIQNYTDTRPHIPIAQTQWLAENAKSRNIVWASQLGDLTNHNHPDEYKNAVAAFTKLDAVIPYTVITGNNDYSDQGKCIDRTTLMPAYFPLDKFKSRESFGGTYDKEPDVITNSYHLLNAGNRKLLLLCLEFGPRHDVVRWANEVVWKYPEREVILTTHSYLSPESQRDNWKTFGISQRWNPHRFGFAVATGDDVMDGEQLWENLVSKHPNFLLTINGHIPRDGLGLLSSKTPFGNIVHQMAVNFQNRPNGGDGWLRLLEFHPETSEIKVTDYSPILNQVNQSCQNDFSIKE